MYLVQGSVCLIASFSNYAYIGISARTLYGVNYMRYIEWGMTAPLIVLNICLGLKIPSYQAASLMVMTDAYCICGLLSALTSSFWAKVYFGCVGCICAISVQAKIFASIKDTTNPFVKTSLVTTSLIYPIYVVTWAIGPDVWGVITPAQEMITEVILSLIVKSLCTVYLFIYYNRLDKCLRAVDLGLRITSIAEA